MLIIHSVDALICLKTFRNSLGTHGDCESNNVHS